MGVVLCSANVCRVVSCPVDNCVDLSNPGNVGNAMSDCIILSNQVPVCGVLCEAVGSGKLFISVLVGNAVSLSVDVDIVVLSENFCVCRVACI